MPIDRGQTPPELAKILRVSADKILAWIRAGELPAVNVASTRCGRPQYIILPEHLAGFLLSRSAAKPKAAPRKKKMQSGFVDYFPD